MDHPHGSATRRPRSHWIPRTRDGRAATAAFIAIFLLAMPPFTHTVFDRIEPTVLSVPFFFVALLSVYVVLIGVLVWAFRRGV